VQGEDISRLTRTLEENEFSVVNSEEELSGNPLLIARRRNFRWSWVAVRLHLFVVVFEEADLSPERAEELSAAAQQYAIKHKGGLPRGLQTGTATFATFITGAPADAVTRWFRNEHTHRYAALRIPVLADLEARKLTWFSGRMSRGHVFQQDFHHIVREVLAPGLNCSP
jgi:hypothetical protein